MNIVSQNLPSHPPIIQNALYIVATPIGNLWDITYRAISILQQVDVIFCEDTRTSMKLLSAFGITTKTMSYHDHNGNVQRPKVLQMLANGKSIALISDAGTPLINDPGYKLVSDTLQAGYNVHPIPGACSAITALMASGLPTDVFTYMGFLPSKTSAKRTFLESLHPDQGTIIVFDTPRRIRDSLTLLTDIHPDSMVVVAREMTKKFEQFVRIQASEITEDILDTIPQKGECVVLIHITKEKSQIDVCDALRHYMGEYSLKDAVSLVVDMTGMPKKTVYQHALEIKNES